MSWLQHLYDTYEQAQSTDLTNDVALRPYYHIYKKSEIIITLNESGEFISAEYITVDNKPTSEARIIPVTIKSSSRTSGIAAHPLCDEFKYIAGDYEKYGGKSNKLAFDAYVNLLSNWVELDNKSILPKAVLHYVKKETLLHDLKNHPNSHVSDIFDNNNILIKPKYITLWRIQPSDGSPLIESWSPHNEDLFKSWQKVCEALEGTMALCYATGETLKVTTTHSKGFLNGEHGAKLISSNDATNYTFRGKFTDDGKGDVLQAANISELYSDKAHAALEWLLKRQGYNNDGLGIVAWAATDKKVVQPIINPVEELGTFDLTQLDNQKKDNNENIFKDISQNLGLHQGQIFRNYLYGYFKKLDDADIKQLSVISLAASTTGRAAITYYRQTSPKDYYNNLIDWHTQFSWYMPFKIDEGIHYIVLSPSLYKLSLVLYGRKSTDSVKKQRRLLYQRLLPCIVDASPFPIDIINSCYQKAINPYHDRAGDSSVKHFTKVKLWHEDITIFCAIYRGFLHRNQKRSVSVNLDNNNTNRSYLFGRLLAVANHIEELALQLAREPRRPTNAFKYMQRFTQKPSQVWMMIRTESLPPYQKRLISRVPPLESAYMRLIQDIEALLTNNEEFTKDDRLDPDFLLGYDLQSKWLREHKLVKGKWVLKENKDDTGEVSIGDLTDEELIFD
ncbi:type I-C CRISPR-associated protein Cas8c/Csd1 [Psychrobacter lutiphocae]|uniref:type I-C CRISPR-associated protein Cas8c/Csd1 n=1 Tax=Psychrobacter lutiphocae TaxID=540500 RepID=UPI00035EDFEE|nr:type I-C CRISPR-associated protein Cas8c/Csd1 [Psychrobacter lutiphocae]